MATATAVQSIRSETGRIESRIRQTRRAILERVEQTPLARVRHGAAPYAGGGKMLRSRLVWRVGPPCGTPSEALLRGAVAVELVHAASLLHDDVIDGGLLRRGAPSFWVKNGAHGAILAGDLLLCEALDAIRSMREPRLVDAVVRFSREMCAAEVEQELVLRGRPADWETSVRLARSKTGSLFAFAAAAAAGADAARAAALVEAGYLAGTAYQLSDDLLDASGRAESDGKTLGSDRARGKTTAATARPGNPGPTLSFLDGLRERASSGLAHWPRVRGAWDRYWARDLQPALYANAGFARGGRSAAPPAGRP